MNIKSVFINNKECESKCKMMRACGIKKRQWMMSLKNPTITTYIIKYIGRYTHCILYIHACAEKVDFISRNSVESYYTKIHCHVFILHICVFLICISVCICCVCFCVFDSCTVFVKVCMVHVPE